MQYFFTFSLFLVVATAKSNPVHVQNKNINIIVNADSKEIAKELWKIIERHAEQDGNSIPLERTEEMEENTVNEIEQVIKNMVEPSRRSNSLTNSDLAKNFERIVRRSISVTGTSSTSSQFDRIKNINDIVMEMVLAVRKLLKQSEPKFIIPKSDESTGNGKLIGPGSATPSSTRHRILRGLKDTKNGSKNHAFSRNDNPDDFLATFVPVINSNQNKSTKINPWDFVHPLKDDVDDELKNHEGKPQTEPQHSNVNINENHFARRNSNTNVNKNQFYRKKLQNNGVYDDKSISSHRGLLRSSKMSPVPSMRHLRKQIPKNSNRRNYNYNSNTNVFGSGSERYQNKLKRQRQDDNELRAKLQPDIESPENDYLGDSLQDRPALSGNKNVNKNINQFMPPEDDDSVVSEEKTKPSIHRSKIPTKNNNRAKSPSQGHPHGNSNINSNTNQIRGGQSASIPNRYDDENSDESNYDYQDYYDDDEEDYDTYRSKGVVSSENLNSNSNINSFRRQNDNTDPNGNYFHRRRG